MKKSKLYESRFGFRERNSTFAWLCGLFIFCVVFFGSILYVATTHIGIEVEGSSMKRTLFHGDKLFAKSTIEREADYGDIIIVSVQKYEECKSVKGGFIIKRLIAKEGDKVKCNDGNLYIWYAGGTGWEYVKEEYAYYGVNDANKANYDFEEYEVGKGEVFFLGDNRSSLKSSLDSRYKEGASHLKKLYKKTDIIGVVSEWSLNNKWIGELLLIEAEK